MAVKCPSCKNELYSPFTYCDSCGWEAEGSELEKANKLAQKKKRKREKELESKRKEMTDKYLERERSLGREIPEEKKERDFQILKAGLNLDRDELYERINLRVDAMMEAGLLDEARSLLPLRNENALKTVGYRELFDHLDGKISMGEAVSLIKRNTRHYARRQLTWFRRDKDIEWFGPGQFEEIMTYIRRHVETAG